MTQTNVQAQFQMQDSYVKEFKLETIKKVDSKKNLSIAGQVGFRVINIREEEEKFVGQIELINDLDVNIHISMMGLFTGMKSQDYDQNKFEYMLKINGATTLSNLIRTYVYTVTGLSGMPQINTPMINFFEFFKNAKEISSEK